jgi:serine/threonine protein kinase
LHRDISPDNILIDKTGNPVLIDFGAASEQAIHATRILTGRRVVKDGYSPQEFYLTGAEQGPFSDLYALGATFFHVITGKVPPESQRRLAKVAEGETDPYLPLDGRFPGYPPGFLHAIDKATRVMPRDRLQSASDWLDLIEKGERELTQAAAEPLPRVVSVAPTSGFVSRNLGYFIGAGITVAVVAVVGLWTVLT